MSRGNSRSHNNSWIGYCQLSRTKTTSYKKELGILSESRQVTYLELVGAVIVSQLLQNSSGPPLPHTSPYTLTVLETLCITANAWQAQTLLPMLDVGPPMAVSLKHQRVRWPPHLTCGLAAAHRYSAGA
jgi:hypothetical protein